MRICFRLKLDDGVVGQTRRFTATRDVPYPTVPRIGEAVVLPAGNQDWWDHLGARRVEEVIYTPDGTVILDFRFDGLLNSPEGFAQVVLDNGYRERPPLGEDWS